MFENLETWLIDKTKGPERKKFWAKLVGGVLLVVLGIVMFIRYQLMKDSGMRAKLENKLVKDDKADAILKDKLKAIDDVIEERQEVVEQLEKAGDEALHKIEKIEDVKKDNLEVIEGIESWEDYDRKVKK